MLRWVLSPWLPPDPEGKGRVVSFEGARPRLCDLMGRPPPSSGSPRLASCPQTPPAGTCTGHMCHLDCGERSDVLVAQMIPPHVGSTGKSTSFKAWGGGAGGGVGEISKSPCVVM